MIELLIALLLGVLAGTFTGLSPGIHINLIAILAIANVLPSQITATIIFITAMATTHTFTDFIPSIFLGAPDEDSCLATLPGHELLLSGNGHRAVILTLIGSIIAILSLIFIIPIFIYLIPKIYPFLEQMMAFFLIWISIFLIYNESKSKIKAILIFFLSGFLGLATLNLSIEQPLLPLLTGLFGTSTIIYSIKTKTIIPKQKIEKININKKELIKPALATIIVSPLCSLFPGLGSSQAAIMGSEISGKLNREQFLILLGSISTLVMSISFVTLFLIGKSRSGTAFAISQIAQINNLNLTIILITILASAIISIPITITISKTISKHIHKIQYTKISLIILIFLILIITYITGPVGLLTLIVSTTLGITCIEFKTRRSFLMGAILIPTITFYLPF
jgi:putative membrane protein